LLKYNLEKKVMMSSLKTEATKFWVLLNANARR